MTAPGERSPGVGTWLASTGPGCFVLPEQPGSWGLFGSAPANQDGAGNLGVRSTFMTPSTPSQPSGVSSNNR
jgi:hypothetical protein